MKEQTDNKKYILICLTLAISVIIAYEPIRHNDFVRYDDHIYVTENPNVSGGITLRSVIWAFTQSNRADWHPVTWLSHMLDCEIFKLNPLGHHITNLILHIANSLLLFFLLSRMTGKIWPSAFVAAAFALHPVHVESVAWVAERKDVLSGLFWMLTILAYTHYAKKPDIKSYLLVLLMFAMGLMSKPMVVTLPFVLLLLDYWPLGRLIWPPDSQQQNESVIYQKASLWRLLAEKIPLFALSMIASVITFAVQSRSGAVSSLAVWPWFTRIVNALGSYSNYILKMLYPKGLAVLYPISQSPTLDAAIITVIGILVLLKVLGPGRKWLIVGLLWYLGTLVPVIGFVKVGWQTMADRYTYLPSIGIFIIIAWGADEIFSKMRSSRLIPAAAATAAIIAMILLTRIQVGYWRDSAALYLRAIAVTKNNFVMHDNYGLYLYGQGRYEEAEREFKNSLRIFPFYPEAMGNLCTTLLREQKFDEAISYLNKALEGKKNWPDMYKMYNNLGMAYVQKGNLDKAEANFRKALELNPDYIPARNNLSLVLAKKGRMEDPLKTRPIPPN